MSPTDTLVFILIALAVVLLFLTAVLKFVAAFGKALLTVAIVAIVFYGVYKVPGVVTQIFDVTNLH